MDRYRRLAEVERKDLGQVMSERLTDCADHNAIKGLWFGDSERKRIEAALGANVASSDEVIRLIAQALRIRLNDRKVELTPDVLARLVTRSGGIPMDEFLPQLVSRLIQRYIEGQL